MAAASLPANAVARPASGEGVQSEIDEYKQCVDREHTWPEAVFISVCISMCITVDILFYSMPLAFLPSVLEDKGHDNMEIATAIGIYYWTGFAGGAIITSYMIYMLLFERESDLDEGGLAEQTVSLGKVKTELRYLIAALGVGAVSLIGQVMWPVLAVHTVCRFIQGFCGAIIFFYAFLLSASLFTGSQQVFAMTAASTALNIAEVLGSSFGAFIFHHWGQRTVFGLLGILSVINQLLLLGVIYKVKGTRDTVPEPTAPWPDHTPYSDRFSRKGWVKLKRVMTRSRTVAAVILIAVAGMIKGTMEEVLPFHADHRWNYKPMQIGNLFSVIAVAYISSAILAGSVWLGLKDSHILFSALWLVILGLSAWMVLMTWKIDKDEGLLWGNLMVYGVALGFTQTPAALLLAEVVEREHGRAKDAVCGVWNTMWEAGGSLGFLLGGLLAESYRGQLLLFGSYVIVCIIAAILMITIPVAVNFVKRTFSGAELGSESIRDEEVPLQEHARVCYGGTGGTGACITPETSCRDGDVPDVKAAP